MRNPCLSSGLGFAAKFNTNAVGDASLIYSSKITGNGWAIAIDSGGNAHIIGFTVSNGGQSTGLKLDPAGNCLTWNFPATAGVINDIVIDSTGNSYYAIMLETTTNTYTRGTLIRKSYPDGTTAGSIRLNGTQREIPEGIAYHGGFVYVAGYTSSLDFPTTPNAIQPQSRFAVMNGSPVSGFVAKLLLGNEQEDFGVVPCQSRAGMPVNVANGNMYLQQTDYLLPGGLGENINITRTYNSMMQTSGLFGIGWSFQYDEHLTSYDAVTLQLQMPDGKAVFFGKSSATTFAPISAGFYGQITVDTNGIYSLTFKDGSIHRFNPQGNLIALIDRNNNQITLNYNTNGHLISIVDAVSRMLIVTPDAQGRIAILTDSIGLAATYAYDTFGRLESVTYPDNSKFTFTYEVQTDSQGTRHLLTEVKDALNNIVEKHEYYADGKAQTSERHGGVEKYTFDYANLANQTEPYTQVTDARNNITKYFIKRIGSRQVTTKTEGVCSCGGSGSETTTYEYDNQLNMTKKVDALGRTTIYTYDTDGNRLTMTDTIGMEIYTYNNFSQILMKTDRMNGVWMNTYDANGNLLTAKDALDQTTTLTYTPLEQLETITDARNHTTTLAYDSFGRLTQVTDANNKTTIYNYDARARLTNLTNALNQTTAFEYDLHNRLKKVIHPDTKFMTYAYDLAGRRNAMTDERGYITNYGYDPAYRLTSVTDALNHATTYDYDLMSNMTVQIDALGNTTNYEYDDFNRLKKMIYPPATVGATRLEEEFEYDTVGNLRKRIDTADRETLYDYDTANRLIKTTDANLQFTQFEYNARSQMTKVKDALNQEYVFTYDPLGRQLTQTRAGSTMSYLYDAVGNRTKRTDYTGRVTDYVYDNLNRLSNINYVNQTGDNAAYVYDDLSRLTSATNYAGTISFEYDNRHRIGNSTDVFGRTLNYEYDANGNRTFMKFSSNISIVSQGTNSGNIILNYNYDAANRLTQMTESSRTYAFGYDEANRMTGRTLPNGISTVYGYDGMSRLKRLKHADSENRELFDNNYSYNPANQISQIADLNDTRVFGYDNLDRLTNVALNSSPFENYAFNPVGNRTSSHLSSSYTHQPFNRLTATQTANYGYNSNGNLTSKNQSGNTTTYTWDYENRLREANTPFGTVSYKYDALGRRVERIFDGDSTEFSYDGLDVIFDVQTSDYSFIKYTNAPGIDNKLSLQQGAGDIYYFLADHLGSTTALSDANGGIAEETNYDGFGNSANQLSTRFQYTGREYDGITGLYFYRARWYDAQVGRFISEDPIGFNGGDVNLFGYVNNNPLMFIDPSGLRPTNLPYYETQRRLEQCEEIKELLRREQAHGTGAASWLSSVTVGGNTALGSLNNRRNGNIPINGKEFDLDWFIDSNAFSGNFSQVLGPSAYLTGKTIWSASNLVRGHEQTYPLPYQDPGEVEAANALTQGKRFKELFTEKWFEEYCPCEK